MTLYGEPCEYEACEIPINEVKKMIFRGTWEGSLEEEEVLYNLQNNLYSEEYKSKIVRLLMLNDDAEKWVKDNLITNTISFEEKQMRKLAYFAGAEMTRIDLKEQIEKMKCCATCSPKHLLFEPKEACRPFKDCDELVEFWTKHYQTGMRPAHTKPLIWVKKKEGESVCLITGFDNGDGGWGSCVFLEDVWIDLKELFDDYEFLDGKPCRVEVKE